MTDAALLDADFNVAPKSLWDAGDNAERSSYRLNMDSRLGSFDMRTLQSRNFCLYQVSLCLNYQACLPAKFPKKEFGFALMDNGRDNAIFDNGRNLDFRGGQAVFTFNPAVQEEHRFYPGQQTNVTYFAMDEAYVTTLIMEQASSADSRLSKLKDNVMGERFFDSPTIGTPAYRRIISDIVHCPLSGNLGHLMLEGSLQQLIALQLAPLSAEQGNIERVNHRDRELIHAVKDHLQKTFLDDHSLLDLSRRFGINQNKLKTVFKSVFGVPVIEHVYNLKMDHARTLLHNTGMYVTEVSRIVGYKNAAHFTTAFKRKFGIAPSRIKA